jgi:hypothetical protein
MNLTELEKELSILIKFMNIPEARKVINEVNLIWLGLNLHLKNKKDRNFKKAIKILKNLTTEKVIEGDEDVHAKRENKEAKNIPAA